MQVSYNRTINRTECISAIILDIVCTLHNRLVPFLFFLVISTIFLIIRLYQVGITNGLNTAMPSNYLFL